MKFGIIADHFEGAGAKYLTEVEINDRRSHQHSFQGVGAFRKFLGQSAEKKRFKATFHWLDDEGSGEPASIEATCTWSNVRQENPNRSAEYHLYYSAQSESVVRRARAGDLLLICKTKRDTLLVILCPANTMTERQMLWLFGLNPHTEHSDEKKFREDNSIHLGFAARTLLDDLGIEPEIPEPEAGDLLIGTFGLTFPTTAEFSKFARETFGETDPVGSPDSTIVSWMDYEEVLFRFLERRIVSDHIENKLNVDGKPDVERYMSFFPSIHNRRKSRAGWAFDHHIAALFEAHGLRFTRGATTEKRNGPDFLFPGQDEYHDPTFDAGLRTMLAVKTSCKDRWRQVLAEADRIEEKHLITLQLGISEAQTTEMRKQNLQLVLPKSKFSSYSQTQRDWLMDVETFLRFVKDRQDIIDSK